MAACGRYYHLPDAWAILVSIVEGGSCDTCAREGMSKVGALFQLLIKLDVSNKRHLEIFV